MENQQNNVPVTVLGKRAPQIIGAAVLVCLLGGAVWYVYSQEVRINGTDLNVPDNMGTTTINVGGITVEVPPGGKVTVDELPDTQVVPKAPTLARTIVFPKDFSSEAQDLWKAKLETFKSRITKEPTSYEAWLELGSLYEMIADYEGAREAWEYVTKLYPKGSTAFGNLGFLFGYYIHDNTKAEQSFKTALSLDPTALYLYQQTFEFYRDVLKDVSNARTLVEEGRTATGNTEFFDQLLSTLK